MTINSFPSVWPMAGKTSRFLEVPSGRLGRGRFLKEPTAAFPSGYESGAVVNTADDLMDVALWPTLKSWECLRWPLHGRG